MNLIPPKQRLFNILPAVFLIFSFGCRNDEHRIISQEPPVIFKKPFFSYILERASTGGIKGRIVTHAGNSVQNAQLILTFKHTIITTALTDMNGRFEFTDIPEGVYSISIRKDGYSISNFENLTVLANRWKLLRNPTHNPFESRDPQYLYCDRVDGDIHEYPSQSKLSHYLHNHSSWIPSKIRKEIIPW